MHTKKPQGNDIGHCFIAIDPGLFRDREEFAADVTRFCTDLRATKPVDPDQPVMVAGDPQWNNAATRMRDGPGGPGPAQPDPPDRPGLCRALAARLSRVTAAMATSPAGCPSEPTLTEREKRRSGPMRPGKPPRPRSAARRSLLPERIDPLHRLLAPDFSSTELAARRRPPAKNAHACEMLKAPYDCLPFGVVPDG